MSNRRRIILIVSSVLGGSLISFWFIQKRVGTLSPANVNQLIFNFIFALAIVIGLSIMFHKMNKKDKNNKK